MEVEGSLTRVVGVEMLACFREPHVDELQASCRLLIVVLDVVEGGGGVGLAQSGEVGGGPFRSVGRGSALGREALERLRRVA